MASLAKEKLKGGKEGWRVVWQGADGKQKALRLGVIPKREAQHILLLVEKLLASRRLGLPPDSELCRWIENLDPRIADRLASAGLIAPQRKITIAEYLGRWLADRQAAGYKPASLEAWRQTVEELIRLFGNLPLTKFGPEEAETFRLAMQDRGLRPTTVLRRLGHAKTIFGEAVRRRLIASNPFSAVKVRGANPAERRVYISVENILRVIEACPDLYWRLLIALARFGGLRTPSESLSLRWQDIDWASERICVPSPKTEAQGKPYRVIPLFPMLRPYLEAAWEAAPEGAVWVFPDSWRKRAQGQFGWKNANFRSVFAKAIRRAGLQPWPRLWHNLRASFESDLAQSFPLAVVCKWLGNTPTIALRHYVDPTDKAYEQARTWTPPLRESEGAVPMGGKASPSEQKESAETASQKTSKWASKKASKQGSAQSGKIEKVSPQVLAACDFMQGFACRNSLWHKDLAERTGFEPAEG